jgi:hypothetical protein
VRIDLLAPSLIPIANTSFVRACGGYYHSMALDGMMNKRDWLLMP